MAGTITMFDSIDVSHIPSGAQAVAGYVNGRWPTFTVLQAAFPSAHKLSIAVSPDADAECLDVEPGDASISSVYGWFTRQKSRGVWKPVIYISAGEAHALVATMEANGFKRSEWRLWTAHYGIGEHICGPGDGYPQADGTQWTDMALGRSLDQSLLADGFFSTSPAPKPKPDPKPAPTPKPAPPPFATEDPVLELDTSVSAHPLLIPFGCPSIDLLSVATEGTPTEVTVTWLDEGNKPVGEKVSWGAAGNESSITVPKGLKKARLDVVSGGGPRLSVRFNPPAQS